MAKVDHLSQLKGRSFYGDDRSTRRGKMRSFNKYVEVDGHQAKMINRFIKNETMLFNHMVEHLNSRLRGTPEFFLELTDRNTELFTKLAFCNFDVKTIEDKKRADTLLPKILHPYADILFGIHGKKEVGLSDKLAVFYSILAKPIPLMPTVRERMASELIHFCINQAGVSSMATYGDDYDAGNDKAYNAANDKPSAYSFKIENLEQASLLQKRHVQLHKDDIKVLWNAPLEQTEITIPYCKKPLILENLDLMEFYPDWDIMIVHQDPQDVMTTHSHWEIELRTTKQQYLYKYMECPNPEAMMKSRDAKRRS